MVDAKRYCLTIGDEVLFFRTDFVGEQDGQLPQFLIQQHDSYLLLLARTESDVQVFALVGGFAKYIKEKTAVSKNYEESVGRGLNDVYLYPEYPG